MNSTAINCRKGTKRPRDDISKAPSLEELKKRFNASNNRKLTELIEIYNDFRIMEERCVIEQIFDLQVIVGQLEKQKIPLPVKFQIGMMIAKLPPSLRNFATSIWQQGKMSMNDLVDSIIEENERLKNVQTTLQKLDKNDIDTGACWACRKLDYGSDSCKRRKSMVLKMEVMFPKDLTASCKLLKSCEVKKEQYAIQEINKENESEITPGKEIGEKREMDSRACWSCRKIGFTTGVCKRQRQNDMIEKALQQKKRYMTEIRRPKKSMKTVSRACWTCRKKSFTAVCCECQKNIIPIQSQNLQA